MGQSEQGSHGVNSIQFMSLPLMISNKDSRQSEAIFLSMSCPNTASRGPSSTTKGSSLETCKSSNALAMIWTTSSEISKNWLKNPSTSFSGSIAIVKAKPSLTKWLKFAPELIPESSSKEQDSVLLRNRIFSKPITILYCRTKDKPMQFATECKLIFAWAVLSQDFRLLHFDKSFSQKKTMF